MKPKSKIAIVGAGIVGITNAIKLLEQKLDITIFSKDSPLKTNSDAAVASWYPSSARKPLLQKLCMQSLAKFEELSNTPDTGISWIKVVKYLTNVNGYLENPWIKEVESPDGLPKDYITREAFPYVVALTVPLADVNIYRPYLLKKFYDLGGKFELRELQNPYNLIAGFDVIINCTGWESFAFVNDKRSHPIRGQTIVIGVPKGKNIPISFDAGSLNAYARYRPQSHDCVIGASYKVNDRKTQISEKEEEEIFAKVEPFIPELRSYKILTKKVGLRAGRWDARIESEWIEEWDKRSLLIHCYGHNSSGYSASWASADMVWQKYQKAFC